MAPDRPDATGVVDGRDCVVGGAPVLTRAFGMCEDFTIKEADHAATTAANCTIQSHYGEETTVGGDETTLDGDEIVLKEEEVPMIKIIEERPIVSRTALAQSDDELTSLSWLHQQNLLKGLEISEQPATRLAKDEVVVFDDSLDMSENTNSVSSFDDCYSHESNGMNSSADSATILTCDEIVINGTTVKSFQEERRSPNGQDVTSPTKLVNGINNNNNNSNSANYNLPAQSRNKHPTHIPYDPLLHKNCKPPYSFSSLIFMAIEDSPVKALPVKEVYAWILGHFPYFRNAPTGWKNSVRHNLSLNKCFRKVEKSPHLGKGSLWMVDAQYRPNLLQALSRTPCPPSTVMNINIPDATPRNNTNNVVNNNTSSSSSSSSSNNNNINNTVNNNNNNNRSSVSGTRLPDPVLFPYLSKRLASSSVGENNTSTAEFDSDVDAAAAAMLAFKHGPIIINNKKPQVEHYEHVERYVPDYTMKKKPSTEKKTPVITRNTNEDHTYSLITSVRLERRDTTKDKIDEEQRKIAEGADALLNLAGVRCMTPPPIPADNEVIYLEEDLRPVELKQYYANKSSIMRCLPMDDSVEIRPIKRRIMSSSGEGSNNKRRKRYWNSWTENGRYPKQVRG